MVTAEVTCKCCCQISRRVLQADNNLLSVVMVQVVCGVELGIPGCVYIDLFASK